MIGGKSTACRPHEQCCYVICMSIPYRGDALCHCRSFLRQKLPSTRHLSATHKLKRGSRTGERRPGTYQIDPTIRILLGH